MDRSSRQKSTRNVDLNHIKNQIDLTDIIFHHREAEYTFLSSAQEILYRTDNIRQIQSYKYKKKIEIKPSIISNHNGMKLKINTTRGKLKIDKCETNTSEEPMGQRRNKNILKQMKWKHNIGNGIFQKQL